MAFVLLKELLLKRKNELLAELEAVEVALERSEGKQLFLADDPTQSAAMPEPERPVVGLFGLPPGKAAQKLLEEERRPCLRNEIVAMLLQRGAAAGSKDPERTIQRALDVNLAIGTLRAAGEVIGLPEWFEKN